MRIGLLTSVPQTHEAFFLPWISRWNEMGHTVFPASGTGAMKSKPPRYVGIPSISQQPRLGIVKGASKLDQWCKTNKLDVVLTSTATASAASRMRKLPCPVVYFCHGLHWTAAPRTPLNPIEFAEKLLLPRTAGVISMNSEDRKWFDSYAPGKPHLFLKYGIGLDLEEWPYTQRQSLEEPIRLLWVGAMTRRKRPLDALKVVQHLGDRGLSVQLDMLGTGPLLKEVLHNAREQKGVQLHGRTEVLPYLQSAHAVLHTAEWEGLPRVLLEAAAVGRPSFGYNVKGVRDAPGVSVSDSKSSPGTLGDLVARWADGSLKEPGVRRSDLDWKMAQDAVLDFLFQTLGDKSRNLIP